MPTLSGRAPAKVNLGLKVLGRRPDGFHELRTVFQTISLADRLSVTYSPRGRGGVTILCNQAELSNDDNLAARAARDLLAAGPWRGRVRIDLVKHIPHGAGLGGGSSDAAGVLRALGRLLRPAPDAHLLFEIAATLGSDVPFFLVGGTAVGVGRGEEVYPLPELPLRWIVIWTPEVKIPTADAYRALARKRPRLTPGDKLHIIRGFGSGICVSELGEAQDLTGDLPGIFENDFEEVIFQQFPQIEAGKNRLVQLGASQAMLSGSGSAVFGLFPDRTLAEKARRGLATLPGEAFLARTLSRRAYRRLWD